MASTPRTPRRGLPRTPGGEPWPPAASSVPGAGDADGADAALAATDSDPRDGSGSETPGIGVRCTRPALWRPRPRRPLLPRPRPRRRPLPCRLRPRYRPLPRRPRRAVCVADCRASPAGSRGRRHPPFRPPLDVLVPQQNRGTAPGPDRPSPRARSRWVIRPGCGCREPGALDGERFRREAPTVSASGPGSDAATPAGEEAAGMRRGLPREPGGEPWPPASAVPPSIQHPDNRPRSAESRRARRGRARASDVGGRSDSGADAETPATATVSGSDADPDAVPAASSDETARATAAFATPAPAADARPSTPSPRPPLTVPRTVWPGAAARNPRDDPALTQKRPPAAPPRAAAAGTRLADFSPVQLLGSTAVLGVFALALVGIVVLVARFVLAIGRPRVPRGVPREYHLPESAPVGLPAWLNCRTSSTASSCC